jgi:hypothetical protein
MKTQTYYPLPTKVEGYTLAVYRSKIVLIGGNVPSSQNQGRTMGDPKYPISVLDDDCGLEKRLKSALDRVPQESRYIYEIGMNACAVGEGDLLIVIGGDGPYNNTPDQPLNNKQEYIRVFNGQNWSYGIACTTIDFRHRQKTLLVFQNHIYMTACGNGHPRVFFCYNSLECFRNQLDPNMLLSWNLLEDVPDGTPCTNLSVLGNQLVTIGRVDGGLRMYAYMARSSEWIAAHEFQWSKFNVKSVSIITGIIGLQSSGSPSDHLEALLVGADHCQTKIYKLTTKCKLILSIACDACWE